MVGEHEKGATGYPGHVEEETFLPSSLIACSWLYAVSNEILNGGTRNEGTVTVEPLLKGNPDTLFS